MIFNFSCTTIQHTVLVLHFFSKTWRGRSIYSGSRHLQLNIMP